MDVLDREPGSDLPLARQFRFDAGAPALNLLATLGFRGTSEPVERLTSPGRLREWLARQDLPPVAVTNDDLAAARELRESGYGVLAAVVAGERPPAADLARLNECSARPLPGPTLSLAAGGVERREPPATVRDVLTGLARDLVELATARPGALRSCAAPTCTMLYLDRSPGRRRQWCSMARCGNRAKAARHRARAGA